MGSTRTYSPWGGGIWPPSKKMAGNALFEIKLGRITKSDVKIKKNPNMFNMTSLWRHSDVMCWRRHADVSKFRPKLEIVVTFQKSEIWGWLTPHFLCFLMLFMKNHLGMARLVKKWWCQHFSFIFFTFSYYPGPRKHPSFAPRSWKRHDFFQKSSKLNQS